MTQKEFAERMDMSEKHISKLINGEVALTDDVAFRLEMVLGIPAQFWIKLEAIYREKIVKANAENEMDEDLELAKKYPYKEMAKYNWVPHSQVPSERVIYLRKYFEVVKLKLLQDTVRPCIACRRISETEKADYALIAWAQKAKLDARSITTQKISIKKLKDLLPTIRTMTCMDPTEFCPKLVELLSECGIAIVFLPHIGGSFLHGATFYDKGKIVVGLTVRGKDADKFWFSLFHELGHIIYNHIGNPEGASADDELAADKFASDYLISKNDWDLFIQADNFSQDAILYFSKHINIDPGIVVGRLQKEHKIEYSWHNNLKTHYTLQ